MPSATAVPVSPTNTTSATAWLAGRIDRLVERTKELAARTVLAIGNALAIPPSGVLALAAALVVILALAIVRRA